MAEGLCWWCGEESLIYIKVTIGLKGGTETICYVCWQEASSDGGAEKYIDDLEAFETYVDGLSS